MQEPQERQVTLRDYMRVLYRGRWIIVISFFAVVLSTAYFTFTTEPVYEASAKLMIEEEESIGESIFEVASFMKKETMINNQVEILKSRTLAEKVITQIQHSPHSDELYILGYTPEGKKSKFNPIRLVKSWLSSVGRGDEGQKDEEYYFDDYVEHLRETISISPIRNTDMIEIKVSALSPFEAAYLTNAVATSYKELNQSQSQAEVRQVKTFLEDQLEQYREQLSTSEMALKNYKEQNKVVALDEETQELVQKIAEFEKLYNEANTELLSNKERLKYIDEQLAESKTNFDIESISATPYLDGLKTEIAEKEAYYTKLVASLVESGSRDANSSSQIELVKKQIEALKQKFKEEVTKVAAADFLNPVQVSESLFASKIGVETELQSLEPKVQSLKEIVDAYNVQLESLPEKSLRLARLIRNQQVDEKIYIMLQEKYQEARISEVGQLGNVRIIDIAKEPRYPVKPKKKLNLMLATLVGLGLGVGIAFVLEYMDNSVRTIEDVEDLGLALMGSVPEIKPEQSNGVFKLGEKPKDEESREIEARLITHYRPKSPISESYRTLRTNIQFSRTDEAVKTILVTSSAPKEGKSTTVANLAITLAQMGMKTILIDTDLRRPVLHKLFEVDRRKGITNVLVGNCSLDEAIQNSKIDDLNIISCGTLPPNPSELLGSRQMMELLGELKSRFDVILFDSPPVIAVTDAAVMAPLVDGVLLVVNSGSTQREALLRANDLLNHVHARVLGILLNNIKVQNVYGSYYYYYYYHYYYGKDGGKKKSRRRSKRKRRSYGYSSSEDA